MTAALGRGGDPRLLFDELLHTIRTAIISQPRSQQTRIGPSELGERRARSMTIPREERGMYCKHGKHIMVADPADLTEYPAYIFADPYPCAESECSAEQVEAEMLAEQEAYEADRWDEYKRLVGG